MPRSKDVLTRLRKAKYLGSHPRVSGHVEGVDVEFTNIGVRLRAKKTSIDIPWTTVTELAALDRDGVERRITAPRLLALGTFALIAKKERSLSYLVIADDRGEWVVEVPGLTSIELKSGLGPLQQFLPAQPTEDTASLAIGIDNNDVGDRLARLDNLLTQGLLTPQEHAAQRQAIISSL